MGKIAAGLQQALEDRERDGARGGVTGRTLAAGPGWWVDDMLCTHGPGDRPFEERHAGACIAMVVAGAFAYRSDPGHALLTPGSLLLGNDGRCFECGHVHGAGDRCLSFHFESDYFARVARDAGFRSPVFPHVRVPPVRHIAPLVARACAGATDAADVAWDELAIELATATWRALAQDPAPAAVAAPPGAMHRVAQLAREIDAAPDALHSVASLAAQAALSDFHFLRLFRAATGVTPHQYVLRSRLRAASLKLVDSAQKIVDVAFDAGFNDVSNFNHAFRGEFGMSPRAWRAKGRDARRKARSA